MKIVGKSVQRVDANCKADGSLQYTDDLEFDGLYGDIIRSSIAYGKIISITYDSKFDFSEFTIVDYKDISGKNINSILIDDQPFLAEKLANIHDDEKVDFLQKYLTQLSHIKPNSF